MSATDDKTPQPSTVIAEPATVQAAADDYAARNTDSAPNGQFTAQPHTHGRQ